MELATVVVANVAMLSVMGLLVDEQVRRAPSWAVPAALCVALCGYGWTRPDGSVAVLCAAAWVLLVGGPRGLEQRVGRALGEGRRGEARRLARLLRLLHPAERFRRLPDAIALLGPRGGGPVFARAVARWSPAQRLQASLLRHAHRAEWSRVLALAGEALPSDEPARAAVLRAAMRSGSADVLVRRLEDARRPGLALVHADRSLRLHAAVLAGRPELVEPLAAGARLPPDEVRRLSALALHAREPAAAREALAAAAREAPPPLARGLRRLRREGRRPLPPSAPATQAALARLELALATERVLELDGGRRPRPVASLGLAALLTAALAAESLLGGTTHFSSLYTLGALSPALSDEPWRHLTFFLLHFGPVHFAMNVLGLLAFGPYVERRHGRAQMLAAFVASALAGGLCATAAYRLGLTGFGIYVGASGGVMGLLGATLATHVVLVRADGSGVARAQLRLLGVIVGLQTLADLLIPEVALSLHLVGLVVGFLAGLWLESRAAGRRGEARA